MELTLFILLIRQIPLHMASDQGLEISSSIPSSKKWKETKLGELSLSAGACVLRLRVDKAGQKLCLSAFRLEKVERDR